MCEPSFSQKVKEEIISNINSVNKADACILGILICINVLSRNEITLLTETKSVADFFQFNIDRICGENSVNIQTTDRRGGLVLYSLSLSEKDKREKLMDFFQLSDDRSYSRKNYPKKNLYPFMIAGMFLSCGSVSDPNKGYHLEFALPDLNVCNTLGLVLLEQFGMLAKYIERKNHHVLYFKESENIIDTIALMGATTSSFDLMNIKIYKDMRNKINRGVNCVNANIEKSIIAAERQIADIELIDEKIGIGSLPENLQQIAMLRYENPDFNLGDLGAALTPPISRSGANHRLKKIAQIASELREKQ